VAVVAQRSISQRQRTAHGAGATHGHTQQQPLEQAQGRSGRSAACNLTPLPDFLVWRVSRVAFEATEHEQALGRTERKHIKKGCAPSELLGDRIHQTPVHGGMPAPT
jgi:hypothetical protein